jgi:hypothetical protein
MGKLEHDERKYACGFEGKGGKCMESWLDGCTDLSGCRS